MWELRVERIKRRLRQVDVANMLSISQQKLSSYELGTQKPNAEDMKKLNTLFGISNGD